MAGPPFEDLISGLFDAARNEACLEALRKAGKQAVPALAAAITNPDFPESGFDPPDYHLPLGNAPFTAISDLLVESGSPEAAAPFLEYFNSDDPEARKHGASCLGNLAQTSCIEPVTRLLAGEDEMLRSLALIGIGHALRARRGAPEFFEALKPVLIDLIDLEDEMGYPPKLLAQIDPAFATPILLDPKHLSLENPQLEHVIAALNEAHAKIPHEVLLPLTSSLESLIGQRRPERQLSDALFAYARNPDSQTEARLRAFLKSPSKEVQKGAACALAALKGLEGYYDKLSALERNRGIEALTEPERNYYMASNYYHEIENGGPSQYIVNSTSNYHRLILIGLRAIGATASAQLLEDYGGVFGPDGPSPDWHERMRVAEAFTPEQLEKLDIIGQRYYPASPGEGENVEMLLHLYVAEHAGSFIHCR